MGVSLCGSWGEEAAEGGGWRRGGSLLECYIGLGAWFVGEAYGRKLQAEAGRWETRVKISVIRRCCTLVSWHECEEVDQKTDRRMGRLPAGCRIWSAGAARSY